MKTYTIKGVQRQLCFVNWQYEVKLTAKQLKDYFEVDSVEEALDAAALMCEHEEYEEYGAIHRMNEAGLLRYHVDNVADNASLNHSINTDLEVADPYADWNVEEVA